MTTDSDSPRTLTKGKIMEASVSLTRNAFNRFSKSCVIIAAIATFGMGTAQATDYTLTDTNFNSGGAGANGIVYAVGVRSDGKILIGGEFTQVNGTSRTNLALLNTNGTLDTSFSLAPNGPVYAISIWGESMFIGGNFTSVSGTDRSYFAEIATNNTVESVEISSLNGPVYAIDWEAGTGIIVGGDFTLPKPGLCRVDPYGYLEESYPDTENGWVGVRSIVVDRTLDCPNCGRIYIGGAFTTSGGALRSRLARLTNYELAVDNTFGPTLDNGVVTSIALQTVSGIGKVIVGGSFTSSSYIYHSKLQWYNTDGSMEFYMPATTPNDTVCTVLAHPDGRVFIGGAQTTGGPIGFTCYLANGQLDPNGQVIYGATLNSGNGVVYSLALQGTNIIVGGHFTGFYPSTADGYTKLIP